MNHLAYDPFRALVPRRSRSLADLLFSDALTPATCTTKECAWTPAVDVREEERQFVLTADIPGVSPKDIDVTFENGVLTIQGERKSEHTEEEKNYRRVERKYGTFVRKFSFPESVDAEQVSARGKDGVLEIVVPKKEQAVAKKIAVQ